MIGPPSPPHLAAASPSIRRSARDHGVVAPEIRMMPLARRPLVWVAVWFLILVSLALACATATRRPLWYDELVTYHLVSQPDLKTFWSALTDGTDLNPPLHHLTVRALTAILGREALPLRLPSIVGFGTMVVCLYLVARPRVGAAAACVALLFPFTTRAYMYALEARPYGLMMGLSALALYFWLAAAAGNRRRVALLGLALSLAAAISTHFYTVFVFLALALGELARTCARRRLDAAICAAFVAGALPVFLFVPVIAAARARTHDFWCQPSMTKCFDFYSWLISTEAIFPLLVLAIVAFLLTKIRPTSRSQPDQLPAAASSMPIYECVAFVSFALIPIFTHVVALTVTHAFTERYALPAVIGISLITGMLIDLRARGRMVARALPVVLVCWVGFVQMLVYRRVTTERDAYALLNKELAKNDRPTLPIIVADARDYLQLHHMASQPLASRIIFARGVAASRAESSSAHEIEQLGHWVDLRIDDITTLEERHPRFLVFGASDSGLVTSLAEPRSGSNVTPRGPELYLVDSRRQEINTVQHHTRESRLPTVP